MESHHCATTDRINGKRFVKTRHFTMHEESIARAILNQIREKISELQENSAPASNGTRKVSSVTISCGELSGVDATLLSLALHRLCAASPEFCHCDCHVQPTSLMAHCNNCKLDFKVVDFSFRCSCGSQNLQVTDGESVIIESFSLTESSIAGD